jgi:hypothetical protein
MKNTGSDWMGLKQGFSLRFAAALVLTSLMALGAATASVTLVIPEALLSAAGGDTVTVRIRLREGTQASVWRAAACASPEPGAFVIRSSGVYSIPQSLIPGPAGAPTCLASDDALAVSLAPARTQVAPR